MLTQYSKRVALKFRGIINHKSANNGLHDRAHRKMLRNISLRNGPGACAHHDRTQSRFQRIRSILQGDLIPLNKITKIVDILLQKINLLLRIF